MRTLGYPPTDNKLRELVSEIDVLKNGCLTFPDLVSILGRTKVRPSNLANDFVGFFSFFAHLLHIMIVFVTHLPWRTAVQTAADSDPGRKLRTAFKSFDIDGVGTVRYIYMPFVCHSVGLPSALTVFLSPA